MDQYTGINRSCTILTYNNNIFVKVYQEKEFSLVTLMVPLSDTFLMTREQACHR